ncbi:MAG: membrane protein insertase YidC [Candidatus Marinimicrobia bacterium]|nr:membrane protein insertase YidC [Candidatus Neomarinimicrobiota bacterium]
MDRKTLLAFALIAIVLILTPWYMNLVAPIPEEDPPTSTELTQEAGTQQSTTTALGATNTTIRSVEENKQQSISVGNSLFTATLSNRGGGSFTSFILHQYTKHDSTKVNLIGEENLDNMFVGFVSLDGDRVTLDQNWMIDSQASSLLVDRHEKSIAFKTFHNGYVVRKTFTINPDSYQIGIVFSFEKPDLYISRGQYIVSWAGGVASTEKNTKDEYTYFKGYAYLGDELLEPSAPEGRIETEKQTGNTRWTAVKTKYFISALIPETPAVGAEVLGSTVDGRPRFETRMRQNVSSSNRYSLYVGPLDYGRVESLGVGLENTMNLGWAIIRPLGRLVTWSLKKMYGIIPNYGLVVILFAVLVKIILNPLTKKQMVSTRKTQALQPQIQRLKEKYKNDPQKLNRAQMALFKEKGVNPLGGCLPLLLQMPILIAFFTVFRSTIEFRGAPFFGWINDLSQPDTLTTIGGFPLNVLPFLMGATMFLQQKYMSPTTGDGGQQKFMLYAMNVFFLFLFYSFPSGLNLYYSVFNILSIVQQKYFIPEVSLSSSGKSAKISK